MQCSLSDYIDNFEDQLEEHISPLCGLLERELSDIEGFEVRLIQVRDAAKDDPRYGWIPTGEGNWKTLSTPPEEYELQISLDASRSVADGLALALLFAVRKAITIVDRLWNSAGGEKFAVFKLGPKVNIKYWAECIDASTNYIRHQHDWTDSATAHYGADWSKAVSKLSLDDIKGADFFGTAALRNIENLIDLGFTPLQIVSGQVRESALLKALNFESFKGDNPVATEWLRAVSTETHRRNMVVDL